MKDRKNYKMKRLIEANIIQFLTGFTSRLKILYLITNLVLSFSAFFIYN